ncbi:uncharacterized protein LOC124894685 [Capsicum annuum]|uniref:uncharacterized protein LOC124894685 n=1 Tax=Capsicum annuum TaxID=4072 RepID=UPI001FB163B3|nr:uncharacterized protein LOC124894685 [Capsicum annuum]
MIGVNNNVDEDNGKGMVEETLVKKIPWLPLPFPQRLKQKKKDVNFKKFINMLKELSLNIPLLENLEKMLGYSRFMKKLVSKKRVVSFEDVGGFGLEPSRTNESTIVDGRPYIKTLVGILFAVLVKVDNFIFLADFVIFDCKVEFKMPIILGRPFMDMGRAIVDMEKGELKFRVSNEEVTFRDHKTMKHPSYLRVVAVIHYVNDP